ncbi:MAG: hypothetical protein IPH11_17635 [Ignavibacteriales bacterium]|nr:hypothetical protein [Ignavibacteriales bacterium]
MPKQDYIPKLKPKLFTWVKSFLTNFPTLAPGLGISAPSVTDLTNRLNDYLTAYTEMISLRATYHAKVAEVKLKRKHAISEVGGVRSIVKIMKASSAYTLAVGESLQVELDAPVPDRNNMQPRFKAEVDANRIVKLFYKKGIASGVNAYCRREGEKDFIFIGTDSISPMLDPRPNLTDQPEEREYYLIYVIDDVQVGKKSPILKVTVDKKG